jgi:hypothetical protein
MLGESDFQVQVLWRSIIIHVLAMISGMIPKKKAAVVDALLSELTAYKCAK